MKKEEHSCIKNINNWKAYLFFIPCIVGYLIFIVTSPGIVIDRRGLSIANILMVLNILIVVGAQAYLAVSFYKDRYNRHSLFTVNAIIPVVFLVLYLLYVCYLAFSIPLTSSTESVGPVRNVHMGTVNTIIYVMLIHAVVNFYFVNNLYTARQIRRTGEEARQSELKTKYLFPMKDLSRASLMVIACTFVLFVLYDVVKLLI